MNASLSHRNRVLLTFLLTFTVLLSGVIFQKSYNNKKIKTEQALRTYYEGRYGRPVDPADLRIWTTLAVCRYGIEKVECDYIDKGRKLS